MSHQVLFRLYNYLDWCNSEVRYSPTKLSVQQKLIRMSLDLWKFVFIRQTQLWLNDRWKAWRSQMLYQFILTINVCTTFYENTSNSYEDISLKDRNLLVAQEENSAVFRLHPLGTMNGHNRSKHCPPQSLAASMAKNTNIKQPLYTVAKSNWKSWTTGTQKLCYIGAIRHCWQSASAGENTQTVLRPGW